MISRQSSLDDTESMEDSLSEIFCPGKAAAKRLKQFESAWEPKKSISTSDEIIKLSIDELHIGRILGHGSFGTAREVHIRNRKTGQFDSEQTFAMKSFRKYRVLADGMSVNETAAADFALETKILANLNHENIITLHGVREGDMIESIKQGGTFFIIIDLLVETLDVRLERWGKERSLFNMRSEIDITRRLQDVATGITSGMAYLHSKNIMFR